MTFEPDYAYVIPDDPKMLRETVCFAQSAVLHYYGRDERMLTHVALLGRLVVACDRLRPLGPDGKHGDRHTASCGCEDKP